MISVPFDPRAELPHNDAIALAIRYGKAMPPVVTPAPGSPPAIGSARVFFVLRDDGGTLQSERPPEAATVTATLIAISAHAYFYADDDIDADTGEMQAAAALFEQHVWPQVTAVFGEPAMPGIDGEPRIIILQADLGGGVAGYVSGDDTLPRAVRARSNEAEIVYLDHMLRPGGGAFSATLAHELQHLIHDHNDPTEEAWVNEGMSELALVVAGGTPASIGRFAQKPQTQLNHWPMTGTGPHYGAAAAFMRYVAGRLGGEQAVGGIARETVDGPAGFDAYFDSTGREATFSTLFADWVAANILDAESGVFWNADVAAEPQFELAPGDRARGTASQFGADYYALTDIYDGGTYALSFTAEPGVPVLPPPALDEGVVWWSNAADSIDTTLTFELDVPRATAPLLSFRSWFDIERWYDFGYLSVSTDGGQTWQALRSAHTSADDPVQLALGPGRSGRSGGDRSEWVDERVDLASFAGRRVVVRFEYVTDGATHGRGWAVRDIRLDGADLAVQPAAYGWVQLGPPLDQRHVARLALTMDDGSVDVRDIPLESATGSLEFSTRGIADAVFIYAGATEGTIEPAPYTLELQRR